MIYLFDKIGEISDEFLCHTIPLLSKQYQEKANRLRFISDKKLCVISYLLLLYGLRCEYKITEPVELDFLPSGKPILKDYPDIYFNISHCKCGVVCAISNMSVGIDIQDIKPINWQVAKRVCSKRELAELKSSDSPDVLFTKFWVIKESICKMTGTGITIDLKKLCTTEILDYRLINGDNYFVSIVYDTK